MEFILYAAAFRLAIIAAGTLFLFLGYRLFVLGVMPAEGTQLTGEAGKVRLTVTNAAPGTCFALFGAGLIGLMIWNGNPEYLRTEEAGRTETRLRGGAPEGRFDLESLMNDPRDDQTLVRTIAGRLDDPSRTLGAAADDMLSLAAIYHRAGRDDEAIPLVRLVYGLRGDESPVLDLMIRVEAARGETGTARDILAALRRTDPAAAAAVEKEIQQ